MQSLTLNLKCVLNPAGVCLSNHKHVAANNPVCDIGRAVVYHNPRTLALPPGQCGGEVRF